jgi:hypothetical protein
MSNSDLIWVNSYYRDDGTYVSGHERPPPNETTVDNLGTDVDGDGLNGHIDPQPQIPNDGLVVYNTSQDIALAETEGLGTIGAISETSSVEAFSEAAATGAVGGGISFAFYQALKEFLSLEGARQRGEISTSQVINRVLEVAWEAGKQGFTVGIWLGLAITVFGSWLLTPLAIIAPFAGIKMAHSLWKSYWDGLNNAQKRELKQLAAQAGTSIDKFFSELA